MRMLRKMTRRRSFSVLSILFVLALTTTTALAARPRFPSALSFSLTTSGGTTTQALTANLFTSSSDRPILLAASGQLADLVDEQKYEVVIEAKGKAEVVCQSEGDYHGSSPKTVDISSTGKTKISPPYSNGEASFTVVGDDLEIDTKRAGCSSHYDDDDDDHHKPHVTILKVMYSSGTVTLFEKKSKSSTELGSFAPNENGKSQKLDQVKFSKCKTKDLNVYCKQQGVG
jgi:hypothetical protein